MNKCFVKCLLNAVGISAALFGVVALIGGTEWALLELGTKLFGRSFEWIPLVLVLFVSLVVCIYKTCETDCKPKKKKKVKKVRK